MTPLALATETDGSIIGPAQINALVGIKPTPGLTSRKGVIPSRETTDTVGPVARSVADAVACLDAISGPDPTDPPSVSAEVRRETSYTGFLADRHALRGARFGLPVKRCWETVPDDQKKAAQRVFDAMQEAGAEIIPVDYPCAEERIAADGKWDWLVSLITVTDLARGRQEFRGKLTYLRSKGNGERRIDANSLSFRRKHMLNSTRTLPNLMARL